MRAFLLLLPVLAACAPTALPTTTGRIQSEEQFRATAVGRTVRNDLITVNIAADGTFSGISDGQPIAGVWEWRDGFWCRALTAPVPVAEDCQVWSVSGTTVTIIRDRGTGPLMRLRVETAPVVQQS